MNVTSKSGGGSTGFGVVLVTGKLRIGLNATKNSRIIRRIAIPLKQKMKFKEFLCRTGKVYGKRWKSLCKLKINLKKKSRLDEEDELLKFSVQVTHKIFFLTMRRVVLTSSLMNIQFLSE